VQESQTVLPARNLKRGFDRLFLVLSVMWLVYWAGVYPSNVVDGKSKTEAQIWTQEEHNCAYPPEHQEACLAKVEVDHQHRMEGWSGKSIYREVWATILIYGAAVPVLMYGGLRAFGGVCLWIWHGYKEA